VSTTGSQEPSKLLINQASAGHLQHLQQQHQQQQQSLQTSVQMLAQGVLARHNAAMRTQQQVQPSWSNSPPVKQHPGNELQASDKTLTATPASLSVIQQLKLRELKAVTALLCIFKTYLTITLYY
jgi:hypothetical protein